mmetsp:Transcript_9764/g.13773  ORF Transcript_9764/g.13773 Transcript_9764/m.13773 type:complete len:162 (-) Transcript_9764:301-786(-)
MALFLRNLKTAIAGKTPFLSSTSSLWCQSISVPAVQNTRWIASSTTPLQMPLDEFRDSASREQRMKETVGRAWSVKELRRKSFDDLHKLWFVLYKEKNMLITEANLSRRRGILFPQSSRRQKVKKSMGAIKVVLAERKRDRQAQQALESALQQETSDEEEL